MRTSSHGRHYRRTFLLVCLLMSGELTGATPVMSDLPSRLSLRFPTALLPATSSASFAPGRSPANDGRLITELDRLERRLDRAESDGREILSYHAEHVAPLVSLLEPRIRDHQEVPPRVVLALVREGHDAGLDPRLLGGVLLVENPWLDATIRSPVGAVGIMQVMPFHAGAWGCYGSDLTHIETNVCHGTRILANALRSAGGDLDEALLLYNGCRDLTSTSDCRDYPDRVQAQLAGGTITVGVGR